MKKTMNLNLPVYDTPSVDTFKLDDWNTANETIDYVFGEFKNGATNNAIDITAREGIVNANSQLADIAYKKNNFTDRVLNNEIVDVFLIGDSTTAGVGAGGYTLTTTPIFTDNTSTIQYEMNHTCPSWANKLRNYLLSKNSSSTLFNGGIGGKTTKYFNTNKELYMPTNKDVVIVMLGTNDRNETTLAEFETNLSSLLAYVNSKSNQVIVMVAPQTALSLVGWANFKQEDVLAITKNICAINKYILIDHLTSLNEKMFLKGYLRTEIFADTVHPNNLGHQILWDNIQKQLGFNDTIENLDNISDKAVFLDSFRIYNKDTLPSDFPKNKIIYETISNDALATGYPENRGGILVTDTNTASTSFYKQKYYIFDNNKVYQRSTNWGATWLPWQLTESLISTQILATNAFTEANLITDYPTNTISIFGVSLADKFNNLAGTVTTYRTTGNGWDRQELMAYDEKNIYTRYVDSTGAWTTWKAFAIGIKGVAIPDTSGVTLANLELEVNKLKAMLRNFNIIA